MKILFLVSSLNTGGAERVATTLSNAWAQRGDDVTLLATYPRPGKSAYALDAQVNLVWMADHIGKASDPLSVTFNKLRALRRMLREDSPDVVVSFLTNVNVMALLARWGLDVPIIVCERTNPAAATNSGLLLKQLRRYTYPQADIVTVQADASVAPFKAMVPGIRRLEVVPNPLPPALFDELPAAPKPRDRKCLMAMGRLVSTKRFNVLIELFSLLAPAYPEWDLVIWGDGPLREAMVEQVASLELTERVSLPGNTDTPWEALAKADAFALTSAVEGFPNVLLEAMALGVPCIAVDCPSGPAEMTRQGEDALLIPLDDTAAFRQGLERLMQDPELRRELGARGAQSVRERYSLAQVLKRWDALFKFVGVSRGNA